MKAHPFLTGAYPPEFVSLDQMAERARRSDYSARRLGRDLGLVPRTFERRFRRAFGCAPRQWLRQQRMRDGLALLESGLTTKEVAAQLGFRDRSSFFRAFRLQMNHTPRRFAATFLLPTRSPESSSTTAMSQTATFLSQTATPPGLRLTEAI